MRVAGLAVVALVVLVLVSGCGGSSAGDQLAKNAESYFHASSANVQCPSGGGPRQCTVTFTDAAGTWSTTVLVDGSNNITSEPGGAQNRTCVSGPSGGSTCGPGY